MNDTFEVGEMVICVANPETMADFLLKYYREECIVIDTLAVYIDIDSSTISGHRCKFSDGMVIMLMVHEMKKIIPPADDIAWAKQKVKDLLNKIPELTEA